MKTRYIVLAAIFQLMCVSAGAVVSLIIVAFGERPVFSNSSFVYSAVVLALMVVVVIIEIASVFKIHDSTVHTVFTSCSILLYYIFSYDLQGTFSLTPSRELILVSDILGFACFLLILLTHAYLLNYLFKLGITKAEGYGLSLYAVVVGLLYAALVVYGLGYIAYVACLLLLVYVLARVIAAAVRLKISDLNFFLIMTILASAIGDQLTEFLFTVDALPDRVYGLDSTYILTIVLLYAGVYVGFMLRTERAALEAGKYKLQTEQLKTRMLREQINPHYVFNSLIAVKEAYHRDIESGDCAMNYFSRHLRANVLAMNLDCIPFGDELDNVENYIGLENIKRGKPVNVIYNVEADDFSLPVLSLQTFVENAVKYARIDEREDGYIAISSMRESGGVRVEIADNGTGFDTGAIKQSSCGIRNAKERFKLLLGADVNVESAIGKGTRVSIFIPDGGRREVQGENI